MKHFSKKKYLQGAGYFSKPKIPDPKPSVLREPNIGGFKILQSYSVLELIDLISDGPIQGLVNKNGQSIKGTDGLLQAVYLDNTPVQNYDFLNEDTPAENNELGFFDIASTLRVLGDVYYQKETPTADPFFKPLSLTAIDVSLYDGVRSGMTRPPVNTQKVTTTSTHFILVSSLGLLVGPTPGTTGFNNVRWYPFNFTHPHLLSRINTAFKEDWTLNMILGGTPPGEMGLGGSIDGHNLGTNIVKGLYFTKKLSNNHSIEVNLTANTLGSEGLLDKLKSKLNTSLSSASANQKHFINLALNEINTLSKIKKDSVFIFEDLKIYNGNFSGASTGPKTTNGYIIVDIPSFKIDSANGISIFKKDSKGNLTNEIDEFTFYLDNLGNYFQDLITPIIVPEINNDNKFTGNFYGCLVFAIQTTRTFQSISAGILGVGVYRVLFDDTIYFFASTKSKLNFLRSGKVQKEYKTIKYNFSNIACEFKNGEEIQDPLSDFKYIYVDYDYNRDLIGPFNKNTTAFIERVQKVDRGGNPTSAGDYLYDNTLALQENNISVFSAANPPLIGNVGSSIDKRMDGQKERKFSAWNDSYNFNEEPVPFTHTIENANVEFVAFTLAINNLYDTIDIDETDEGTTVPKDYNRKIGEKRPAILRIKVEVGTNIDGKIDTTYTKSFAVIALTEGQMLIDFGDPSLKGRADNYISVRDFTDGTNKPSELSEIFPLPEIDKNKNSSIFKRFIKVTKLSAETNSVLIKKEAGIFKVTEIIPNQLSYPFSAIMGIKLDGRSFSQAPERTYDCRLKKVKIPSNYYPLDKNKRDIDKRYIADKSLYNGKNLIYEGDWDGSFKDGWTDNPAWIIYDLLTNNRYGLGSHLDGGQINKWELYKIARFCDAVDDEGYFVGVSDGIGGLEPRYSCNIVFREATKIYDAIVSIANLFRGMCYFYNSEIHFVDDRPRLPIITFTNNNVKDGIFNYSNIRRDQQYNTIEVSYLDRFDNFRTKIEYVEDEEDIRKRGYRKSRIETFGVTSRAMARRMGQHIIYQTIKENQAVEFTAGLEALLCRPGDLMIIDDDLKTRSQNQGKILEINTNNKSLLLNNTYLPDEFNGKITVYTPTGHQTSEDIQQLLLLSRSRLPYFDITDNLITSADNILTGRYHFSEYKVNDNYELNESQYQQYPLYTGLSNMGHKIFCYYNINVSGFVFSTGLAYQDNNIYDKVITDKNINEISEIKSNLNSNKNFNSGYRYQSSNVDKRGAISNISGKITIFTDEYNGILESEIDTNSNPQITNYNITGYDILDYGSRVFLDQNNININLLPLIEAGSPYRIGRKNAEDQIYKILTIKEENQNEYVVVGSKFNTGKFVEIENFSREDFLPSTYYSGPSKVGNIDIKELSAPKITSFVTGKLNVDGSFSLIGSWDYNTDALKYRYNIYNDAFSIKYTGETTKNSITIDKINALGDWKINLYNVGNGGSKIDSQPSKSGIFVGYYQKEFNQLTKAAIIDFKII